MEADTYSIHRHYPTLLGEKVVLQAVEKSEGLSCLSGECWKDGNAEMDLPWQFGPEKPLDVDSEYVTIEESPVPGLGDTANNCKKASDSELEWQWIVDHQQTYKSEWLSSNKLNDSKTTDDPGDAIDKERGLKVETDSSVRTSSLFSGSKTEGSSDAGTSNASKVSGNLSIELNTPKLSHKDGLMWRTAGRKELAALVARKGHGYLENCDLPSSQSSVARKGPFGSFDITSSKGMKSGASSADQVFLASYFCSQEPMGSVDGSFPSSGPMQHYEPTSSMSEAWSVPSTVSKSFDNQPMSWKVHSGRHAGVTKQGFEALGEALCHSQTRARQAEKLAAQALQEQEKFARLLFRESWTARTYKQWVQTLELENMWLKMSLETDIEIWMGKELSNISSATGQTVINSWKHCRKRASQKKMHRPVASRLEGKQHKHASGPETSAWLRCTIGLAFALGLSFAGAGLMIGWSMGWILLSH